MNDLIIRKLKKYLLFISIVFFVTLGWHLGYGYMYTDASAEPIEGGTISEAIIGSFPHFNPLVPSSDHNAYINGLLYRSMLQYSTSSELLESDLVSCNLENLLQVDCILENNLTWSDGTNITTEDIKATLDIIKETQVNPLLASHMENTEITITDDSISFINEAKDINFLDIFLQPIVPKRIIEELDTQNIDGKFSEVWWIYSGRFLLSSISQDETVWITKITLGKNENYFSNDMYIQFLILNFFQDESHFLKNKNSFNIFNDKDALIGTSIPRLEIHEYTLPQFVASFFNIDRLPSQEFRSFLSRTLSRQTIIENVGKEKVIPAYNPFLTDKNIDGEDDSLDLAEHLKKLWYVSKDTLLETTQAEIDSISAEIDENETNTEEPQIISNEAPLFSTNTFIQQESLKYITSPSSQKYNFVSSDNILVTGNVDSWVDAVYINDYRLQAFTRWDETFNYRLSQEFWSIAWWENKYKVYYESEWEKKFIEEFVYIYNTDEKELERIEDDYFQTAGWVELTPTVTLPNIAKIQSLDDRFYYDDAGNPFSLKVIYAQTDASMAKTAETIPEMFAEKWIVANVVWMPLSTITEWVRDENLDYDIMLIGINLWYFDSDIYPYFHSSQVDKWYNFSNFQNLSLDILLEELKSNNLSPTTKADLIEKMLRIFSDENIMKVLYTPKTQLLVDRNIKNFYFPDNLPDSRLRFFALTATYLEEKKIINTEWKGVSWFISYLVQKFTS